MKLTTLIFILHILILSSSVFAKSKHSSILESIKPYNLTIIGETHKRPESYRLFQSLVDDYLKQHRCLAVALEIASSQQEVIDRFIENKAKTSDIEVTPPIDHPEFRSLIENLTKLQRQNTCFKLIAVDADIKLKTDRDAWMADRFIEEIGERPIIALLGNMHTLKKVVWNPELTRKPPYVPEILISRGYKVQTYPQIWKNRACTSSYRFIRANKAESTELLVASLFSVLNATAPKTAVNVVNGIVLWECD